MSRYIDSRNSNFKPAEPIYFSLRGQLEVKIPQVHDFLADCGHIQTFEMIQNDAKLFYGKVIFLSDKVGMSRFEIVPTLNFQITSKDLENLSEGSFPDHVLTIEPKPIKDFSPSSAALKKDKDELHQLLSSKMTLENRTELESILFDSFSIKASIGSELPVDDLVEALKELPELSSSDLLPTTDDEDLSDLSNDDYTEREKQLLHEISQMKFDENDNLYP